MPPVSCALPVGARGHGPRRRRIRGEVGIADRGDRSPEVVGVLGIEDRDEGIVRRHLDELEAKGKSGPVNFWEVVAYPVPAYVCISNKTYPRTVIPRPPRNLAFTCVAGCGGKRVRVEG